LSIFESQIRDELFDIVSLLILLPGICHGEGLTKG
jgi:hypothetical protein